jgi:hypothetical protein
MTAKAKKILRNLRGATTSRRMSFSDRRFAVAKDDANFTVEGADIRLRRRPDKLRTNALSVKLRGSHAT